MKTFALALSLALGLTLAMIAAGPEVEKSRTMGNPGAPLRMDLYSDFTCPHCKMLHEVILPKLINDYVTPGKAYLVFHEYTLTGPGHEYSKMASLYADAAAKVGKYQQVSDALFSTQSSWALTGKVWEAVAPALNEAERKKVQALVKEPSVEADVQRDLSLGNAARVDRTPTMIITHKGKQTPWSWWENYALFRSLLDSELQK
jgi:protein-disulfide isomerase